MMRGIAQSSPTGNEGPAALDSHSLTNCDEFRTSGERTERIKNDFWFSNLGRNSSIRDHSIINNFIGDIGQK
jgi:hypothetical protein